MLAKRKVCLRYISNYLMEVEAGKNDAEVGREDL